MAEKPTSTAYGIFFQVCRDESLSQETQNREFSFKALGIFTFGTTLFGLTVHLMDQNLVSWLVLFLLSAIALAKVYFVWKIISPAKWRRPLSLDEVAESLKNHKSSSEEARMCEGYARAIKANWKILDDKAKALKWVSCLAAVELAAFVVLQLVLRWPGAWRPGDGALLSWTGCL